jgi:tRNA(Ile)-lysidine synthase
VPAPPVLLGLLTAALDTPDAPPRGEHLLVAVSGGPDSTALLAGLAELGPGRGLHLTAGHVDHRLREESAAEGSAVRALANRLGVAFVGREARVDGGPGMEARARRARYRALAAMAAEVGATRIALGHTRDDQVETILMRLLRGAGRRGLGAMRRARGRLWRPLLAATRADVRRFLAERELPFAVDRTNADLRLTRTRLRRVLVPLLEAEFNPRLGASLAALADRLRDEDDFLAAVAAGRLADLATGDGLRVAVALEPRAIARRIVRRWLEQGMRRSPGAAHVERVLALAAGHAKGAVSVPGPARVRREGDVLVRRRGRGAPVRSFALPIVPGESVTHPGSRWRLALSAPRSRRVDELRAVDLAHALFDADVLPSPLVVRSPVPGDRVRLLAGGTRKLQDVLVDAKVPREARPDVPVLIAGEEIVWVAGLARGRTAAVDATTTRVVEGVLVPGLSGA